VKIPEFFERFRKLADPSTLIEKITPNDKKEKEFVSRFSLIGLPASAQMAGRPSLQNPSS
jgi:hypothetical protein